MGDAAASTGFDALRVPAERPGPAGGRRDANRRQRTEELCRAGLERALAVGLGAVTVDEVARDAGLSKAGFYRYFEHLPALYAYAYAPLEAALDAVAERAHRAFAEAEGESGVLLAYAALAADLVEHLSPMQGVLRLYLAERHGPASATRAPVHAVGERIRRLALELTATVQRHGFLVDDVEVTTILVLGAVHELVGDVLHDRVSRPPEVLGWIVADALLHGVRRRAR